LSQPAKPYFSGVGLQVTNQDVVETSVVKQLRCTFGESQSQECLAANSKLLGVYPAVEKLCALSEKFNFPVQ